MVVPLKDDVSFGSYRKQNTYRVLPMSDGSVLFHCLYYFSSERHDSMDVDPCCLCLTFFFCQNIVRNLFFKWCVYYYSSSIVPGGFGVVLNITKATSLHSFTILADTFSSQSKVNPRKIFAVIKSSV